MKLVPFLGIVLIGLSASGLAASGQVTFSSLTPAQLLTLESAPNVNKWIAEGRNPASTNGDYEFDLQTPSLINAQYVWASGTAVPFEIEYKQATGALSLKINNSTTPLLSATAAAGKFSDLVLRTFANNVSGSSSSSIALTNLKINGSSLTSLGHSTNTVDAVRVSPNSDVEILRVNNASGWGDILLSGDATMTWSGTAPARSNLAFQVKAINEVPEPGSIALLVGMGAGGIGFVVRRRR